MVKLCRWFLTFDHTNFSRWLSVHVNDLVFDFLYILVFPLSNGRSIHNFSLVAKYQSHEHSNRQLQAGCGGLSDLYDDTYYIAFYIHATCTWFDDIH